MSSKQDKLSAKRKYWKEEIRSNNNREKKYCKQFAETRTIVRKIKIKYKQPPNKEKTRIL